MVGWILRADGKICQETSLNFDELNTLLVEVESVIKSRPITYIHDDTKGISYPLCPSD